MALREMTEARDIMLDAPRKKKPAMWLMSPQAEAELGKEVHFPIRGTLHGLPIRIIDTWSWGWVLLDEDRARRLGITNFN